MPAVMWPVAVSPSCSGTPPREEGLTVITGCLEGARSPTDTDLLSDPGDITQGRRASFLTRLQQPHSCPTSLRGQKVKGHGAAVCQGRGRRGTRT